MTGMNTNILVRNWSLVVTILLLHVIYEISIVVRGFRLICGECVCVFCNRYVWDFRRGKVKNHMNASDEKAPIFAHKHISKMLLTMCQHFWEIFWTLLWKQHREANSNNCNLLMTKQTPLPNFCRLGHSVKEHNRFHDLYPEPVCTE